MEKETANQNPEKKSIFAVCRPILIVILVGYLFWTLAKGNPKFQAIIAKVTNAQAPAAAQIISVSGESMGTFWNVKIAKPSKEWNEARLAGAVQPILDNIDALMSTYKPESEVSRFNQSESTDWFSVSPDTAKVVDLALRVSQETGGALDITAAPLVNFWRFGPNKEPLNSFPSDDEISAIRAKVGYTHLAVQLDPPALKKEIPDLSIDLSAVAKGYSVDAVAEFLLAEIDTGTISGFMVDVGGETCCGGTKGRLEPGKPKHSNLWTMGIETPEKSAPAVDGEENSGQEGQIPGFSRIVRVQDYSIATSGNAKNAFLIAGKRFSHIIDPSTGKPTELSDTAETVGSVSVFLPSCAEADAYATALYVLGPEKGIELANKLKMPVLYILCSPEGTAEKYPERESAAFSKILSEKMEPSF